MTLTSTQATAGTSVSGWLLPTLNKARLEKVVMRGAHDEQPRARSLGSLGAVARQALVNEVEAKLRMVMNETVADLVVGGWRAHTTIRQAVRKSRSEPGIDQLLPLRNHTITADRQHDLDVEVDGVPVMTLSTRLVVRLQLYDAVAVVRDGHLVAVRSGQAKVTGAVVVEDVELAARTLTTPLTAELVLHRPRDLSS